MRVVRRPELQRTATHSGNSVPTAHLSSPYIAAIIQVDVGSSLGSAHAVLLVSADPLRRRERFRTSPSSFPVTVMENDRGLRSAVTGSPETKRSWIAPAVLDLGAMRELTLLQGPSIPGGCDPDVPFCG